MVGRRSMGRAAAASVGMVLVWSTLGLGADPSSPTPSGTSAVPPAPSVATGTIDPGLSAYALLASVDAAAVLGDPFVAIEDGGVVPSYYCVSGAARVLTAKGLLLDVTLETYGSVGDALDRYAGLSPYIGQTPEPFDVPGGQGVQGSGMILIQRGPQLLSAQGDAGPVQMRRIEKLKEQGKDNSKLYRRILAEAGKLAPALSAGMTGTCPAEPVKVLPVGAVDPCAGDPAELEATTSLSGVRTQATLPLTPPWVQCQLYSNEAETIYLSSVTSTQLAGTIAPTTTRKAFDAARKTATREDPSVETFTEGPFRGFGATGPGGRGIDLTVLFTVPTSAGVPGHADATTVALAAQTNLVEPPESLILRFLESSSGTYIDYRDCGAIITWFLAHALDGAYGGAPGGSSPYSVGESYSTAKDTLVLWCEQVARTRAAQ